MAEPAMLFDIQRLEVALKAPAGSLTSDAYTVQIARMASEKVRSIAEQPNWVDPGKDPLVGVEVHAPWRASDIAVMLAKQAWQDRGNLQRRTAGPISQTFDTTAAVRGLDLAPEDRDWLRSQKPAGNNNGLWVLKHYGTTTARPRHGDLTPDGYSFAAGDMDFSHGMSMGGPADGDSW